MDTLLFYGFPAGALFIESVSVFLSIKASKAFDKEFGEAVVLNKRPRKTAFKSRASRSP